MLRSQIEEAAAEWQAERRAESRAWPDERVLDAVHVIEDSGVSLDDVKNRTTVDAFLGPTAPEDLKVLPGLGRIDDATKGSGRYGEAWRLPLGHEARVSVGVRLALLGDRREGVELRADDLPDIAWRRIDGGDVTIEIRKDPNDPNSEVIDRQPRTVGRFWMARYPVTVTQFRAFLDACHGEEGWRLPRGSPFDLGAWGWPPPKPRARLGNHPMDSVNWYDACAFCHWLSVRLGIEVRLPTEFEWQYAATSGDPAFTYPWGAEWDPATEPWRANTFESELGRSTAVGLYPLGASRTDILDMAGTVYEWCLNQFDEPDVTEFSTSTAPRVLRGGSWYYSQDSARSASRDRYSPGYRSDYVGFRVVCSSPSSGH